jgi:hypothetical protein
MYFQIGNTKTGNAVVVWSLPPLITCPGKTQECAKFCYARRLYTLRPNIRPNREVNLIVSKSKRFVSLATRKLKEIGLGYVRVHEMGDFYSETYAQKWMQIARNLPSMKFLAFTKSWFPYVYQDRPSNFTIVYSIWPDTKKVIEELPAAIVLSAKQYDSTVGLKCNGKCSQCFGCWLLQPGESVLFRRH